LRLLLAFGVFVLGFHGDNGDNAFSP
jgi:hypothetical protein